MRNVQLLSVIYLILTVMGTAFAQVNNKSIDYQSLMALDGSTSPIPVGYAFDNYGPFTAYDKLWVFYTNGENAVWQTKNFEEDGEWSGQNVISDANNVAVFNVAFDGQYFHIIRGKDGDLLYRRGKAQPDGSIQFTDEVTAYSDPEWKVRSANPRHYSIMVDHENKIWVGMKVGDGDDAEDNYKPIAIASVATDGTWENREGFPVDLAPSFNWRGNGRSQNVIEISPGNVLFTWSNDRRTASHAQQGMRARLWSNGTFGDMEVTELPHESAASSVVVPEDNIVLLNSQNKVARRNSDGTWERVDPDEVSIAITNFLTAHNGEVRIWSFSGSDIKFQETQDNGTSWNPLTTKWTSEKEVFTINGTHAAGSQGSHHSIIWASGDSPYDIYMGIDGTLPLPNPPTLVSPPDGTTDLTKDVTLTWEAAELAHTYDIQVATESDFSSIVLDESGIVETNIEVTGLDLNITHYWRARSVSEGGTESAWSPIWNFETVGIPPAPVLTSPSDGAKDQPTSLIFTWEETPGAETYQLQIATVSDFTTTFYDQSNLTDNEQFVDGFDNDKVYYWRVRAINEFGEGEWSDVWNYETKVSVPSTPVLTIPENQSTNLPVALTFEWEAADLAESYRLQVSKVSDFSSTVVNTGGITATSYEVSDLEHSQTYYWRVNASNESGTGSWSSVWNFTTIIEKPEVPVLVAPADEADDVSTKPLLNWEAADRAETYSVQLASDSAFSEIILDGTEIDTTSLQMVDELDEFTTFYWRVNGTNIGGTSDWSDIWQFTTGEAFPAPPVLVSPDDGSTDVETEKTLLWNSVPRAMSYRVQVSVVADFSETVYDNDGITNTFLNISDLQSNTEYFWRVRGISDRGAGDWSEVWSFTTRLVLPDVPVLASPEDGADNISIDTTLYWNESENAENYRVQVATISDFTEIVADSSGITDLSFDIDGLESLTTYYWRVRAENADGPGDWSATWSFMTYDVTSVRELASGIPGDFILEQNYPNPFNPITTIRFAIPEAATVRLEVYNMLGQRVTTLINDEHYSAGTYEAMWDARDATGNEVSSGIYVYRISANDYVNVRKMLLMK